MFVFTSAKLTVNDGKIMDVEYVDIVRDSRFFLQLVKIKILPSTSLMTLLLFTFPNNGETVLTNIWTIVAT